MKNKKVKQRLIFFKDVKLKVLLLTVMYIIMGVFGVITPIFEAKMITSITDNVLYQVILLALAIATITILSDWISYFIHLFWHRKIKSKIIFNVRKYIIDKMLQIQITNYDEKSTGYFLERLKDDPSTIARVLNGGQANLIFALSRIGIIIYILMINKLLGLIYIEGMILESIVNTRMQKKLKSIRKICRQDDEETNAFITESVRGIRDIKVLYLDKQIRKTLINKLETNTNKKIDLDNYSTKMYNYCDLILVTTVLIVIIVGIHFVSIGRITSADLIVLYLYYKDIFTLMNNISYVKENYNEFALASERIFDLADNKKFKKDVYGNKHIDDFKGKIEFKNVNFGYKDNKNVLTNFNLTVNPKDTIAIVGSSGSGKTTIFNLIGYIYKIKSGTLKLDGVDINELDEETIRNNISIITQSPYIFNMSIKDNLLLVKENATIEELDEVCKKACLYDYIYSLPNKYDTIIGEGGVNLSGGQKQRLAIARALLKDCKILMFDEATSSLDNITQKEIQLAIDNISKDYTVLIVAHRLSTIKNCNKIYILDKGHMVDSGTHVYLIKHNNFYKQLYSTSKKNNL